MTIVSAIGLPHLTVAVVGRLVDQPADHVAVRPNAFLCPANCSVIGHISLENLVTPGSDFTAPVLGPRGSAQAHHGRARGADHIAPSLSLLIKSWCAQPVPKFLPTAGTFGCKKHLGRSQPLFAPWARIAVCDVPSWPRRGACAFV
jgi:hypothetical protein